MHQYNYLSLVSFVTDMSDSEASFRQNKQKPWGGDRELITANFRTVGGNTKRTDMRQLSERSHESDSPETVRLLLLYLHSHVSGE